MNFRSDDVSKIGFRKSPLGYNKEDVDDFLNKISEDYAENEAIIGDLNLKIENIKLEKEHYRKVADTIQTAMTSVQEESVRIKSDAQKKALEIIKEAQRKSDEIYRDMELAIAAKRCELDEIIKRLNLYKTKAEAMLNAQLQAFKWMEDNGGMTNV